jgi:glycosyltransferase involved in cell wall biosynthesis
MKPFILVQGPVATRSGYGNHTRDLVTSLIKSEKYDIQIISLPWGNTPSDALKHDNAEHVEILKRILTENPGRQPDVFIQISVPNEFQKVGKYNIGITAGIETTAVSHEFIQGANNMDLLIVTSEHAKTGFVNTVYDKVDEKTKQKQGSLKIETPVEVLFEGADLNVYKKNNKLDPVIINELSMIKNPFCFLFVGHWLKGDVGQDRKDVGMMIKTFCEAFKNKAARNRPALILKTSHATFSIMDREEITNKIQHIIKPYGIKIPEIYLIHGDLTDVQMNDLYNHPKIKAMISFTKGEGFGRPLLEFSLTGKPIIASNWSGHVDFLKHSIMLPGQLTDIHASAADKFLIKGSKWFTVNYPAAAHVLRDITQNYKNYLDQSRKQAKYSRDNFSLDAMSKLFCDLVDKGLSNLPQQINLNLPKLKKIGQEETPKIKLPKLTKG